MLEAPPRVVSFRSSLCRERVPVRNIKPFLGGPAEPRGLSGWVIKGSESLLHHPCPGAETVSLLEPEAGMGGPKPGPIGVPCSLWGRQEAKGLWEPLEELGV